MYEVVAPSTVASATPSRLIWYELTPTLSVDAVHDTDIEKGDEPLAVTPDGTDGGEASATGPRRAVPNATSSNATS